MHITVKICQMLFDHTCSCDGNVNDLILTLVEYHISLQSRCGVVDMNHNILDSLDSFKGTVHQFLTTLGQHLYFDIIRDLILCY